MRVWKFLRSGMLRLICERTGHEVFEVEMIRT
jgi:hypothetical protein